MSDLETVFDLVNLEFPKQEIRALLIGGHAVNAHGFTRATLDVDFMIVSDQEEKVRTLMKAHGFVNQSLALAEKHGWSFDQDLKPLLNRFGSSEVEKELRRAWEART